MADSYEKEGSSLNSREAGDQISAMFRRCRGRPRLTDTDRAKRRLESRKKYDVRRVYLGESHKVWSELRRRTGLSDAGLAEYLILLNATYGEVYQQKYGYGKKSAPGLCVKQKRGKKVEATSLRALVGWYQDHSRSCPHEPQLQAPEMPALAFPTSLVWCCIDSHSFVQHLSQPAGGSDDSETEGEGGNDGSAACTEATPGVVTRTRRKRRDSSRQYFDVREDLEETRMADAEVSLNDMDKAAILGQLPESPVSQRGTTAGQPTEEQSLWEMEVVIEGEKGQEQESENEGESLGALPGNGNAGEGEGEGIGVEDLRGAERGSGANGYECAMVTATVIDRLRKDDPVVVDNVARSHPQPHAPPGASTVQVSGQGELYEPQTLQTVVASCQIPNGKGALEGSQVIIITGPGYEALASEGIQLNVGGGVGEEVTCTVIEGVAYNQVCQSDVGQRSPVPDAEAIRELSGKQILQPSAESRDSNVSCGKELQRSLSRSRRNRRGPVIEADGMLKMFHCPYEGCSQVYVAISSFQNHVNLVHRKGRTKVCPHPGCGKKFYLSNHLHRHMIIHSGVRDFICETCGKSFKRKNHLEVHRRTHTGETPLQCEICGYQCRQRASLNWHMKKHTSEAQYNFTCEHCGKRFEKLDSVKFHKLKSHPDKQAA
uniref:Zinc finger protein 653 n=1 Tax=Paramormyrops kingsleyae TaxID=1676925 RepID=A0A3B3S7W7_9TELE|nr:zinc finger protein 653 [Paramormyrops kingsleyae]